MHTRVVEALVLHLMALRKYQMSLEKKPSTPVKMTDDEIDVELVNDSLGETTASDSTGLDSKEEARKREHPV
jgi:hypothetical protein